MPRAFDPALNGGGLPITHSPLNRMPTSVTDNFDLQKFLEEIINALPQAIETLLFPAIENLTGIDLSSLLPLLHLLHFDLSSPAAFIESLIAAVIALPEALIQLLVGLVDQLVNLPETLTHLLSGLIELLLSLTTILRNLLTGLVTSLTQLTGIDLSVFLPLLDLLNIDFSSPSALLSSLMTAVMSIPSIVADIMTGIVEEIASITGIDLTVFLPVLDLLNVDFTSPAAFLASLTTAIMSIPEVFIDFVSGFVDTLVNLPETLTQLITEFVAKLGTLPGIVTDLLHSLIISLTDMTGIDLTIFLPLLDLLNIDFTSPEAFVSSLVTSIMAIPAVIEDLLGGLITTLGGNPTAIEDMLTSLIDTLVTLPAMLGNLLSSLVNLLVETPDILLSLTTSLIDLLVHTPDILTSLTNSLIHLLADLPTLLIDLAQSLLSSGAGLLGADSPLNALNIFGILGGDLIPGLDASKIISGLFPQSMVTNLTDDLSTLATAIINLDPQAIIDAILGILNGTVGDLRSWAQGLLGFGNAYSGVPNIGSGQIHTTPQNLLINGIFDTANVFAPANGWSFEPATAGTAGVAGAIGSALAAVTGGVQTLIGNAVSILTGQTININTQTQWSGLTTAPGIGGAGQPGMTGPPVGVSVNLYDARGNQLANYPLSGAAGAPGAPGLRSAGLLTAEEEWDLIPDSGPPESLASWQPLTGSLTIPATVDGIVPVSAALQFTVSDEIVAGEVRFAAAGMSKTSLMPQDAVNQLPEDQQNMKDAVGGTPGAGLTDIQTRLLALAAGSGEVDWNYQPHLRNLNDEIVNQFNGWDGTLWEVPDASSAIAAQKTTVVGVNTAISSITTTIAKLRADVNTLLPVTPPPATNVSWNDGFDRVSTTDLGSDWDQAYVGTPSYRLATANGNDAAMVYTTDNVNVEAYALWSGAETDSYTDKHTVRMVFSAYPQGEGGANSLLARANTSLSNYLKLYVTGAARWYLYYAVAGVEHLISQTSSPKFYTTYELRCGTQATPARLEVWGDSQLLWQGNDANHAIGSGYRRMGFTELVATLSNLPGAINSWSGSDY